MIKVYETSSNEFSSNAIVSAIKTIEKDLLSFIEIETKITSPYEQKISPSWS